MRKRNRSHDENAAEPESSIVRQLRPKKLTRTVSPPLSNARLSNFVYALVFLTGFLMTYYAWRLYSWKMGGKGGISQVVWNRVRGNVPQVHVPGGLGPDIAGGAGIKGAKKNGAQRESVEDKIDDLARVLGMPSKELASAIAIAVREYVPPASLSSIAAKETGAIVDALVTGHSDYVVDPERIRVKKEVSEGSGVIGNVASGMGSFVGMEEP
ncbi:hypothetical protein BDN72DRAFT_873013 [Pluteus cervinus]|uniref:Uncharacterized protein n=1 Tax=Pluteus cervinus TaxID=181527 RepID=A0ACD3A2D1_9AGAR|nr:hypothetical protein BDN72DRAFT_873013 [Pluteus cervinus]